MLEVLTVRYLLVGNGNTGRFESVGAVVARKLNTGEISTATAAFQDFKELYPSDDEFKQTFRMKQERNNQKAQYYLRELEKEARRIADAAMAGELEPASGLTLEHIMPRSDTAPDWKAVHDADPAFHEDCVRKLGNMCLLSGVNKDLGTKAFPAKSQVYKDSKLITTRTVADFPEWNRNSVEQRQQWLAKLAAATWRFQ